MDLAEPITVLVPGVFASTMTDGLVAVAETRKPGVDAILVSIDVRAFGFSMIYVIFEDEVDALSALGVVPLLADDVHDGLDPLTWAAG